MYINLMDEDVHVNMGICYLIKIAFQRNEEIIASAILTIGRIFY